MTRHPISSISVASFELGQWHAGASRRGFASTIVAILLILHWAAPRLLPFEIPTPSGDTGPTLTSQASVTQHGNLPRAVPRPLAFEAAQSKPQRHDWCAGGKLDSLHASLNRTLPPVRASDIVDARIAVPVPRPASAFYARGPPSTV